jgi:glycosyltransferase involved in cell wall biosynthesis
VLQRVGAGGDLRDRWRVRLEQRRYVTRIVVPARVIEDRLRGYPWLRADERVIVIPNGVDLSRFRPGVGAGALRGELGIDAATPLIVAASQLSRVKGIHVLIQALAALGASDPPPRLALIGEGDAEGLMIAEARRMGVADRVHAIGFRRNLDVLLEDADVVAHPSMFEGEGLPNSVLEAMAKGRAVVAARIGGTGEALINDLEGLLVPPGDADALALAIGRLLADRALRERLGASARLRMEREFDEDLMVDRMEALLFTMREEGRARGDAR